MIGRALCPWIALTAATLCSLLATISCAQSTSQFVDPLSVPLISLDSSSSSSAQTSLPDAPSAAVAQPANVVETAQASFQKTGGGARRCNAWRSMKMISFDPTKPGKIPPPCNELVYPYQKFLNTDVVIPMTWQQKGYFALHNWVDPGGLTTIVGISAINIAANPHTAYGPGMSGFGKLAGVSLLEDATGEFFGIFAVPSLTHQDPRYYRIGKGSIRHRILGAVSQSYIAYSDDGHRMPNYGVFLSYTIGGELANLYVPGLQTDGASTATRIATGIALEPVNNLVTEFLPDVAKRVHVRIIFVQNILNNIAITPAATPP